MKKKKSGRPRRKEREKRNARKRRRSKRRRSSWPFRLLPSFRVFFIIFNESLCARAVVRARVRACPRAPLFPFCLPRFGCQMYARARARAVRSSPYITRKCAHTRVHIGARRRTRYRRNRSGGPTAFIFPGTAFRPRKGALD